MPSVMITAALLTFLIGSTTVRALPQYLYPNKTTTETRSSANSTAGERQPLLNSTTTPALRLPSKNTSDFKVKTLTSESVTIQVLPSPTEPPDLSGTVQSSLDKTGRSSCQPFRTESIPLPTYTVTVTGAPSSTSAMSSEQQKVISSNKAVSSNIFLPISTGAPPSQIGSRPDHPVPRQGIVDQNGPLATNKFYANFFLGAQNQASWTHPYSVSWSKGSGNAKSWGLSVSHIDANQRAFGQGDPAQYFINPIGLQSVIFSATELSSGTVLTTDTLKAFSVNVNLSPSAEAQPKITFPLVQGMGFVTAKYNAATPLIQSSIFFRTLTAAGSPANGIAKYKIVLEDGKTWLLYLIATSGIPPQLEVTSNSQITGTDQLSGFIQIAKNPEGNAANEAKYDASAGVYATQAEVSGTAKGVTGTYSLNWGKAGVADSNRKLIMFALPHHVQSFDSATAGLKTAIQLQTTTKGMATGVVGDAWNMTESNLATDMDFAPWSPTLKSQSSLSASAIAAINSVSTSEVSQDMNAQTNLDSMYFSGKGLSKFASMIYVINDITKNKVLANAGLAKLKAAFAVFATNKQKYPLVYETAWKGVVSTGAYVTGDAGQDFGNTYYNDHHFHYGYFIFTAAVIGYLDPSWLAGNQDYVNTLVRDAANPSTSDTFFPFSRAFDWYNGHSWAKGVFESADGKDEESSSEDAFFAYALKMWGRTTNDPNMEARGNLMLSILARTLQNYFLMESSNTNQLSNFIENKVTGILFENKCDHVTYFGTNPEYIQGIHMVPLNPSSALTRTKTFVDQEWAKYFNNGRVDQVAGGWRGILYANYAITNPTAAFEFFSQANFDAGWLDGGASRTWYLAYAAGLGGAPN
ncbi:MAG: hypothetical protein M1814_004253 [Vezdaea aestivalis]|nr:MAG: hypothetical protein M1814_004253 [Vezdaea aestivalis]